MGERSDALSSEKLSIVADRWGAYPVNPSSGTCPLMKADLSVEMEKSLSIYTNSTTK